jgi:hypothetical protein
MIRLLLLAFRREDNFFKYLAMAKVRSSKWWWPEDHLDWRLTDDPSGRLKMERLLWRAMNRLTRLGSIAFHVPTGSLCVPPIYLEAYLQIGSKAGPCLLLCSERGVLISQHHPSWCDGAAISLNSRAFIRTKQSSREESETRLGMKSNNNSNLIMKKCILVVARVCTSPSYLLN